MRRKIGTTPVSGMTIHGSENCVTKLYSEILVYAQNIRPILTPEAVITLRRFWIQLRQQGIAGKRSLGSIFRIAEATANLRLREIVDDKIAQEVQESIRLMPQRQAR